MSKKYNFKPGDKFGRLQITGEIKRKNGVIYEKCICECGTVKWVSRYHLVKGATKSCGCLAREETKKRNKKLHTKHGMFGTTIYMRYMGAKSRCTCPENPQYHNYGGRGIKFLWNSFEEFYADMGESFEKHLQKFGQHDTQLDRIDVNGDYCKGNCRRATYLEQQTNRRDNIKVVYKGKKYPAITELSKATGVATYIIRNRLRYGWSIDDAVEVPIGMTRKKFHGNSQ